ncbi:MAG: hypothetical protein ACTSWP_08975 [Candidatus Freyarchaeota archaeon]|nr:hypothetical protein [Candidatus Freyrarchaeum guaymaensis]
MEKSSLNTKRRMLVKSEDETSREYGKYPDERSVEELLEGSFVNIDKPAGPTSHEVSSWVRRILNCKKTGHAGTLEPLLT